MSPSSSSSSAVAQSMNSALVGRRIKYIYIYIYKRENPGMDVVLSSSLRVNGQDDRWPANEPKISEVCDNDGGSTKEKEKKNGWDTTQCRWVLPIDFLLTPAECARIFE